MVGRGAPLCLSIQHERELQLIDSDSLALAIIYFSGITLPTQMSAESERYLEWIVDRYVLLGWLALMQTQHCDHEKVHPT